MGICAFWYKIAPFGHSFDSLQGKIHVYWIQSSSVTRLGFIFVRSAGVLLIITAVAKLISAFGRQAILDTSDPIFGIHFRWLMFVIAILELVVAAASFVSQKLKLSVCIIAWLATNFLLYRFGLWLTNWRRPCPCMGSLYDVLHIPSEITNFASETILAFLLIGGYGFLWLIAFEARIKSNRKMV
ncbi:MAG: hypothetical protein ACREFR_00995 [Limisphaerales bacterium]